MLKKVLLIFAGLWLGLGFVLLLTQLLDEPSIEIEWHTETEYETAGFNLLRSDSVDGQFEQINLRLIPAKADAATGGSYRYVDQSVIRGTSYYYRLEDVSLDNSSELHDVISYSLPQISAGSVILILISFAAAMILLGVVVRKTREDSHEFESDS